MSLRTLLMAIAVTTCVRASPLRLSVWLEKDTVVQYEPLYARVRITNPGSSVVSVPDIRPCTGGSFDFRFETEAGEELQQWLKYSIDTRFRPSQYELRPGETIESRTTQIGKWTGRLDPENKQTWCFPPGKYSVRAFWRVGQLPDSILQEQASSIPALFTVSHPTPLQKPALKLYRELAAIEISPSEDDRRPPQPMREQVRSRWTRLEGLARRIITECPAEPYAVLANVVLGHSYWSRARQFPQFLDDPKSAAHWHDSVLAACRRQVEDYPDSPISAYKLVPAVQLLAADADSQMKYLADLERRVPGTRVARAAASLREQLTAPRK